MERNDSEFDVYYIPPNFIEGGTVLGGMFKLRNVIEAGILALGVGIPIFMLDIDLTARILMLCFTSLPLALLALIGISGESLFSYLAGFFKFLFNRRVIGVKKEKKQSKKKRRKKHD